MKRYKQTILSNFFVTTNEVGIRHLVEANLDIESRDDRALCTEVLQGSRHYEVLTNYHLPDLCMICSAILDRRIGNMPKGRKSINGKMGFTRNSTGTQVCLLTHEMEFEFCDENFSGSFSEENSFDDNPAEPPEEQVCQFKLLF